MPTDWTQPNITLSRKAHELAQETLEQDGGFNKLPLELQSDIINELAGELQQYADRWLASKTRFDRSRPLYLDPDHTLNGNNGKGGRK